MSFWNEIYNSCCNIFASNPLLIVLMIVIPPILFYIYCLYYKKTDELVEEFKQFEGFKFSHKIEVVPENETIDRSKNSHFILYGSTGSGKTSFLKHFLTKNIINDFLVFGRDPKEWEKDVFIDVHNFGKINIDNIENKTIILDDAGAYTNLKKNVEDFFRNGRHNNIQVIYLAHYAKDVLPIVRENITRIFITLNNQDSFFENIIQTYCIRDKNILNKWQSYKQQNEYGIIELDTRNNNFKIYNSKYNIIFNSNENTKFDPSDYVKYDSYFFKGELYNDMKLFFRRNVRSDN